jgi:ABC-2 type transport system permease protein
VKLLRDTWLVFGRYLGLWLRNPAYVIVGLLQPAMFLLLFAPLLKSIASTRGFPPGGAYNVFVPGLLIQLGLFGAAGVGFSLIAELRSGVIERFRVTPVSRVALLLGRALRDVLSLLVQASLLTLLAIPFGLRFQFVPVLIVLGLVALIGLTMACALWLRSEDAYAPLIFTSSQPLLLLSGVLLPLTLAPVWLQNIAAVNPLSYAVTAARAVFNQHMSDPSVEKGLIIMAVLAVLALGVGVRQFGRAIA